MKRIWRSFNFNIGRILAYIVVGLIIALFSSFLNLANVNAAEIKNINTYGTVNGTQIYVNDTQDDLTQINNYRQISSGNELNIRFSIEDYNMQAQNYVVVMTYCSTFDSPAIVITPGYDTTNSELLGNYTTTDSPSTCQVNGYTGATYQAVVALAKKSNVTNFGAILWAGRSVNYTSFVQITNIAVYEYTEELVNSIESLNKQNQIINSQNITNNKLDDVNQNLDDLGDKQDQTNEKLDELNDNITDTDTSGSEDLAGGFFEDFDNEDYGLSDIITMPLQVINNITSATCSPLELPLPFVDTDVALPCMYDIYEDHFGGFLTIYQTITFGIVAYWVCINIFRMVKNFKNPDNDEVEVLDL